MKRIGSLFASVWVILAFAVGGVGMAAATPTAQGGVQSMPQPVTVPAQISNADMNDSTPVGPNATIDNSTGNVTGNDTIPPGARLSGVVGIQRAEFKGEMEVRRFGLQIGATASNDSKARVVANETERIRERLHMLENRSEQLNASGANWSGPPGIHQAREAIIAAEMNALRQQINYTDATARKIPPGHLQAHGVNSSEINQLRNRSRHMTGPMVAERARQIGGPNGSPGIGPGMMGPPEQVPGMGPPNETGVPGPRNQTPGQGSGNMSAGPEFHNGQPGQGPANGSAGPAGHNEKPGQGPPQGSDEPGPADHPVDGNAGPPGNTQNSESDSTRRGQGNSPSERPGGGQSDEEPNSTTNGQGPPSNPGQGTGPNS